MRTVLVVDDEPDIVDLVATLLGEQICVLAAHDGVEALELIRSQHPDLVLADLLMPRLDGRGLFERIRSDPSMGSTRVLLMTAAGLWPDPGGCGADAVILKPFDIHDLKETVDGLLSESA